jgi:hypothetical protein
MKTIGMIILAAGMVFLPHPLHAQTARVGSFNGDIMRVQPVQNDSIVSAVAEARGLQLVPSDQVPLCGTWSTSAGASWPSITISPNSVIGPIGPDDSLDWPEWTNVYSNR